MPGLRDLKRRIKSVQSTRKITRAMQLVSAAKMRKAQNAVLASRTYSTLAWELIANLSGNLELNHPLLAAHQKAKKVGIITLGTNGGFVGSLNTNLLPKLKEIGSNSEILSEIMVYGKKARALAHNAQMRMVADFEKNDRTITTADLYPLAKYITDAYLSGEYRKIVIVYNHFVSTLIQKPTVKQMLPFAENAKPEDPFEEEDGEELDSGSIFEPNPQAVLEHLLPRIIESQLYQSVLESNASEHSARMVMMKNATEAAGDLIADYTLTYNQLRQNKITTELAEITAGKVALE